MAVFPFSTSKMDVGWNVSIIPTFFHQGLLIHTAHVGQTVPNVHLKCQERMALHVIYGTIWLWCRTTSNDMMTTSNDMQYDDNFKWYDDSNEILGKYFKGGKILGKYWNTNPGAQRGGNARWWGLLEGRPVSNWLEHNLELPGGSGELFMMKSWPSSPSSPPPWSPPPWSPPPWWWWWAGVSTAEMFLATSHLLALTHPCPKDAIIARWWWSWYVVGDDDDNDVDDDDGDDEMCFYDSPDRADVTSPLPIAVARTICSHLLVIVIVIVIGNYLDHHHLTTASDL